jgi:peptidoglycan/xylan/chitin deacetylase (PgdA/CDA1 family)
VAEHATILLYHGVTDGLPDDIENCSGKHLAVDIFEAQMRLLAERARPMTLRDLASRLARGQDPGPNAVVVTFDDDYGNIHRLALPVLKRWGIPATFFIATGFVETSRLYWTDTVEHCLSHCRAEDIHLACAAVAGTYPLTCSAERIHAITSIKTRFKDLPPDERDVCLKELIRATGVDPDQDQAANYTHLTWDQVRDLDEPPLYEVGGHTVNHEILCYLDDESLTFEIDGCLAALKRQLGRSVDLFSYPEGQAEHYDERVISALKTRGITICPSAVDGVNLPGADPFQLKRIMVGFMGRTFPLGPST